MPTKTIFAGGFCVLAVLFATYAPLPLETAGRIVLGLAFLSAICWTLEPISIELTALCLLLALPLTGVATFDETFSAFGRPAVWLVFAGMVISQLITETRLGDLLASTITSRLSSPVALVFKLCLIGVILALLIPSGVVRVLIILPILIVLLDGLKAKPYSPLSAAVILSVVCATYCGGTGILTASVPNLVIMGVLESHGHPVYWAEWAGHMLPVIGILRVITVAGIILILFRPRLPETAIASEAVHLGSREWRALILLVVGVLGWSTDTIHHIHPVIIGLALTILCITPGIGPLTAAHLKKCNYPILIYIGSVFALGEAIVSSGAGDAAAVLLTQGLDTFGTSLTGRLASITAIVTPFNFLVDVAVVGGVITPPLLQVGDTVGLSALQIALSVAVGTGVVFIPYQSAPFMVAYAYGYVTMRQYVTTMVLICLVNLILLVPINLLYWAWIGFI